MAIFRINRETRMLLEQDGVCDEKGKIVHLPELTQELREIAQEYMQLLFSYGNGTFIPNLINNPLPDCYVEPFLFQILLPENYDFNNASGTHKHIENFYKRNLPDNYYIKTITGANTTKRMSAQSGKLIAFKTKKGIKKLENELTSFILLENANLTSIGDNIITQPSSRIRYLTAGNAEIIYIQDIKEFANQEIMLSAYYNNKDRQICIFPQYGIGQDITNKIELAPLYKTIYKLVIDNCTDIDGDKILEKYSNLFDPFKESKRYKKLKENISKWKSTDNEIARRVDKINDEILKKPENCLFVIRKKEIESHVSETKHYIIPYFYLTERFDNLK